MSITSLLCEDTLHYIMGLMEDADRVNFGTACHALAEAAARFYTASPFRPRAEPYAIDLFDSTLTGPVKLVGPRIKDETLSGVLPDGRPFYARLGRRVWKLVILLDIYPALLSRVIIHHGKGYIHLDFNQLPMETFRVHGLLEFITRDANTTFSRIRDFFYPLAHVLGSWTPPAAILADPLPPYLLPVAVTLRSDQRSFLEYFWRLERRADAMLPMGEFPSWIPIKKHGRQLWVNVTDLNARSSDTMLEATFAPHPGPGMIEYTSRIFWLCDAHGMGKTVSMLALILGSALYTLAYIPTVRYHSRATLVVAQDAMCKGYHSWVHLAKLMYPHARVILVEPKGWNRLSTQEIKQAHLVIMPVSVFADHYSKALEYSGPEDAPTILDYHWQRIVFDDYRGTKSGLKGLSAGTYYILTADPPFQDLIYDKAPLLTLMKYRPKGTTDWAFCPSHDDTAHLGHYIMTQCMWRRRPQDVPDELTETRINRVDYTVPRSTEETILLEGDGVITHGVPCQYNSKLHKLVPCTLSECANSRGLALEKCPHPLIETHGSLATILLLLLKRHWATYPTAKAMILCPSSSALLAVGEVIKSWDIPIRSLSTTKITYTRSEHQRMKSQGKKNALAIMAEGRDLKHVRNSFLDVHHLFILGHVDMNLNAVLAMLSRPQKEPTTLQVVLVRTMQTDPMVDMSQFPFSGLHGDSF
jgi:hypothetical protein